MQRTFWLKFALFNFVIVALLGVVMRYKTAVPGSETCAGSAFSFCILWLDHQYTLRIDDRLSAQNFTKP